MLELARRLKRYAVMTGTVVAVAVAVIAATRPDRTMGTTELVRLAVTVGLAVGGPIWIIGWVIEVVQERDRQ